MKKKLQRWAPVVVLALISAVLLYLLPEAREPFGSALIDYAKELIIVLPAVLLMGLLSMCISNEFMAFRLLFTIIMVSLLSLVVEKCAGEAGAAGN